MSFSSNVKAELCRPPISRRTEALAEAYGVLLYCNTITGSAGRTRRRRSRSWPKCRIRR